MDMITFSFVQIKLKFRWYCLLIDHRQIFRLTNLKQAILYRSQQNKFTNTFLGKRVTNKLQIKQTSNLKELYSDCLDNFLSSKNDGKVVEFELVNHNHKEKN